MDEDKTGQVGGQDRREGRVGWTLHRTQAPTSCASTGGSSAPTPQPRPGVLLTITHGPGVLPVVTVMLAPGPCWAESQGCLVTPTPKVVQEDGSSPLPKEGASGGGQRTPTAQLPAGHRSVPQVPGVITHRPPAPTVPHLQAAGAPVGAVSQTQPGGRAWMWGEGGEQTDRGL